MSMAAAYNMKKRSKKNAQGTMEHEQMAPEGGDIVDRVMAKRMSKGGMVANDTSEDRADAKPNEFDDLVLRDELEGGYTGANSGDERGNSQENEDRADVVARIMRQRKMKQSNPRPA